MASAAYRYNADKSSPDFLVGEWATAMPNNDAGAENCVEVAPTRAHRLRLLYIARIIAVHRNICSSNKRIFYRFVRVPCFNLY